MRLIATVPPTINKYIGRTNRWQYQADKKAYEYENIITNLKHRPSKPLAECDIELRFYFKDNRVRDLNNYEKFIYDFLVSGKFIEDDNYKVIKVITMSGYVDTVNPRVEIDINEWNS